MYLNLGKKKKNHSEETLELVKWFQYVAPNINVVSPLKAQLLDAFSKSNNYFTCRWDVSTPILTAATIPEETVDLAEPNNLIYPTRIYAVYFFSRMADEETEPSEDVFIYIFQFAWNLFTYNLFSLLHKKAKQIIPKNQIFSFRRTGTKVLPAHKIYGCPGCQ